MKKKIINSLKFLIFFGLGIFLFWYVYRDQEIDDIIQELKKVNYWWIILSMILGILSHISRALRWSMLINSLGYSPKATNSFFSVMISYLANLAAPRLGEVTRPTIVKKYEHIPYSSTFGTIVLERIIDIIFLLILSGLVFITQFEIVMKFLANNPEISSKFENIHFSNATISGIVMAIIGFSGLIFFLRKKFKHTELYIKIRGLISNFTDGLKAIKKIKNLPLFIFHSLFIWAMYYLMMYVCFFAFDFTSDLGLMACLTLFVMGSYGMVAPVQGGIGAWHFMVIGTLLIFGVEFDDAGIFALVAHGSQTFMIIIVGSLSLVALPFLNKKQHNN